MSDTVTHRLELWFMRDLRDWDRAALFRLSGITHLDTNAAQQKAFRKILEDAARTLSLPRPNRSTPETK